MELTDLKIDRGTSIRKKQTRRRSGNPWVFRGIVLALLLAAGWLFSRPLMEFVDSVRLPTVRVIQVTESHPATVGAVAGTAANGHVVAARRAALSADTPGRIVEMNVTEGSVVKKGDIVARLYSDEYAAALKRAEADLLAAHATVSRSKAALDAAKAEVQQQERNQEVAEAQLEEAKAGEKLAALQYGRAAEMLKTGVSSQKDVDEAKASLETSKAQVVAARARVSAAAAGVTDSQHRAGIAAADLEVARARVEVAQAGRDQTAATLEKTYVRAPFDGIVVLKDAEVGEVVSPNSQGGSSARGSVCTMVDFASLEVQADLPETSLEAVTVGARANVYLDAFPERTYPGRVSRIWPTANRQKASIEVRVTFDMPDQNLRPDMGVRVVFVGGEKAEAESETKATKATEATEATGGGGAQILIPVDAVVEISGKSGAFVLERDVVRFQGIELGERRAGRVNVQRGLKSGQRIVLEPPSSLKTGARVRVEGGT